MINPSEDLKKRYPRFELRKRFFSMSAMKFLSLDRSTTFLGESNRVSSWLPQVGLFDYSIDNTLLNDTPLSLLNESSKWGDTRAGTDHHNGKWSVSQRIKSPMARLNGIGHCPRLINCFSLTFFNVHFRSTSSSKRLAGARVTDKETKHRIEIHRADPFF